jgi:hypothetical protein
VSLEGPESVAAGTEITITVNVAHRGNSAFHYTNWVVIKAGSEEIARWLLQREVGETVYRASLRLSDILVARKDIAQVLRSMVEAGYELPRLFRAASDKPSMMDQVLAMGKLAPEVLLLSPLGLLVSPQ